MKSLPFFVGIFMFFGLEAVFYWPKFFYVFLVFGIALISLAVKFIFKPGQKQDPLINRGFWYFLVSSLSFFLGTLCSVIFVKHGTLFYIISALSSILVSGFFYTLNKHFEPLRLSILNIKEKAEIITEDNFSSKIFLFNLMTLFFVFSAFFGFVVFFRIPFWYLLPFVFLITIFQTAQIFFVKSDYVSLYDKRISIIGLLVLQFFVILNYFSMTFLMSALFLVVFYGIAMLFVSKDLYKREGKWCRLYQVLIGVIILLVSLLTLRI